MVRNLDNDNETAAFGDDIFMMKGKIKCFRQKILRNFRIAQNVFYEEEPYMHRNNCLQHFHQMEDH